MRAFGISIIPYRERSARFCRASAEQADRHLDPAVASLPRP
jgi:hypothetical protein